jgi:malonate-semialdehyde dehydrogenase (acetylating)/methylmalonate-semialdehyde dehydrogenase
VVTSQHRSRIKTSTRQLTAADFPAMVPLWSIPLACVVGNCLILKPSERDPGTAMILAELASEAGFPDGVLNIIHGSVKTVDFIIDAPEIKAISFVGGNRAGKYIYKNPRLG